ncbi:MAG TPA: porin family protein [Chitinophaga sp.]|uniref:porin family protein n=1 Tax=Chitinophaga sp. TaxID=1869181 RepID=UPI002DBF26E6|nr:porin family protein [Chitinophaga sp.]HEU4553735.1 porin family protein [Chitinophaga sp.]
MKKQLLFIIAALCCASFSYAQVTFGIKAGFSAAGMSAKYKLADSLPSIKENTKTIPAFHAGIVADITLAEGFYLQPGLFYSAKGAKITETVQGPADQPLTATATVHLNYLELPINFLYKHPAGPGKIFAGFGPYLAYGIAGKIKTKVDGYDNTAETDVKFENKQDVSGAVAYVKPFDAGANFIAGYEMNMGLLFSINYSLGLTNTSPYNGETEKNHYLGISIGYLLKRK